MLNLGVLASGRGSNFQAIIDEIGAGKLNASIKLLIVDNSNAYAIERAKKYSIEYLYINPKEFSSKDDFFLKIANELKARNVELVVLAGFMRIVRKPLIDAFPNRIMNIHPALLPSFPGLHGQKQASDYGVRISGCTVHFVDEGQDTGPIILQKAVNVEENDTVETLKAKVQKAEQEILPIAIKLFLEGKLRIERRRVLIEN